MSHDTARYVLCIDLLLVPLNVLQALHEALLEVVHVFEKCANFGMLRSMINAGACACVCVCSYCWDKRLWVWPVPVRG